MNDSPADFDLTDRCVYAAWTSDTIRYADLDPNGHVNNGAVNAFFEDGRVRFRDENLARVRGSILAGFVLARYTAVYRAPLHYPGAVKIGTAVLKVGRTSYTLGQAIFQEDVCAATAEVVTVCLNPEGGTPVPISDPLRAALEKCRPPAHC